MKETGYEVGEKELCPNCKEAKEYGSLVLASDDSFVYRDWTCPSCGAEGCEYYEFTEDEWSVE